ncbi:MAG: hypothetical protein HOO95_06885 [Gallionella sp.]|nr:hypothetical protein [Gallionella sp.]
MSNTQTKSMVIFVLLAVMMAATRFNHFGSTFSLPDASYAVFFLGGLYLARMARVSVIVFIALLLEAGLIDFYATSVQGISDWCMTPAYWFLIPTYGSLWLVGRWVSSRPTIQSRTMGKNGLMILALSAWVASSFAFAFSNVTFYLFSERFVDMSMVEYSTRVAQYYVSYVSVALLYIACAVAVHIAVDIIGKHRVHSH